MATVFVIADAWDGAEIMPSIARFLEFAAGGEIDTAVVTSDSGEIALRSGGSAPVVAYVGHNGLMDSSLNEWPQPNERVSASSSVFLACVSKHDFLDILQAIASHPLLLTT